MKAILEKHINWYLSKLRRDRLDSTAAHGAFFIFIAFVPFIALLLLMVQRLNISGAAIIEETLNFFPPDVSAFVEEMLSQSAASLALLPFAAVTCVWFSSKGMISIIKGLDTIYEVPETRNYIVLRIVAIFYIIMLAVALILTAVVLVFGDMIYSFISDNFPPIFEWILLEFKSIAGFLVLLAFFCIMFNVIPRKRSSFFNNLIGAAISSLGWILFSYFFSIFVNDFSKYSVVYGSLTALVILMIWLYSCMYIMFLGAVISYWLQTSGIKEDLRKLINKRRALKGKEPLKERSDKKSCK